MPDFVPSCGHKRSAPVVHQRVHLIGVSGGDLAAVVTRHAAVEDNPQQ